MMDLEITKKVAAALEREGVRYIIIGGIALNLLGLVRTTEDLDLFVAPERANLERLKVALRSVFADPTIDEISTDELLGEYPAVQYNPPEGSFHLDILTRLGEAFEFRDLESLRVDFDGQTISVASPRTLYRMKKGTVRPKDWGDATALRQRFRLKED
jgi:hypothetical protein